jgi:hypothetical protein
MSTLRGAMPPPDLLGDELGSKRAASANPEIPGKLNANRSASETRMFVDTVLLKVMCQEGARDGVKMQERPGLH